MRNQFTVVQDFYKSILEKRAMQGSDEREAALQQIDANQSEQKKDLSKLFASTKKEEKADTSTMNKALDAADKDSTDTSNPLLKIAMNQAFFHGLRQSQFLKTASADYMKLVYSSFQDEMAKIAAPLFSMNGPGKMLAGLGKATAQVAKKPPPIPAAAMKQSWKPGSVISGHSIAGGGVPGHGGSTVNWAGH